MSPAMLVTLKVLSLQYSTTSTYSLRDPRFNFLVFPPCPSPFRQCASRLVEGQEIEFDKDALISAMRGIIR
jgi:predicted acylesterase/phospholipase RssA